MNGPSNRQQRSHPLRTQAKQEISQAEASMHFLSPAILEFVANGRVQGPQGNRDPHMAPHGVYPCVADDSWIAIACATEEQWRTLSDLMGLS
jgi:benzylsuccinate CoA-transferase BbsF subunit